MPTRVLQAEFNVGLAKFLRSDNGTEQMAVNGSSTWAEDVWDGDTTAWTRGGAGSVTTDAKHSGTYGLDTGVVSKNTVWWFDYGSNRDLLATFDSISFWMNPQAFPEGSKLRCGWAETGSLTIVGTPCQVTDYVPNMDPGVWERVQIPLSDFNLAQNVGRFIMQTHLVDDQRFYLDDFDMLNSTGDGPYKFRVLGEAGMRKHVSRITLVMASGESGWSSSAFANIVGGLELGLILRQGILSTQEVVWSVVMKNNMELFGALVPSDPINFSDGELMIVFNITPGTASIVLDSDSGLEFIVRDDLSTLTNMRAFLQYGVELGDG
jgi:hypothetical protein